MTTHNAPRAGVLDRARELWRSPVAMGVLVALLAAFTHFFRLTSAPDTVFDETAYTRAAWFTGHHANLSWGEGTVFIHPPFFFLLQSLWLRGDVSSHAGPDGQGLFDSIYWARGLDAALSTLLVVAVFVLAYAIARGRPHRMTFAVIVAVLVSLDALVVHFGRMVLIEPMAALVVVVALVLFWRWRDALDARRVVVLGVVVAVALLTKELTVFFLLTPAVYGVLVRDWRFARRATGVVVAGIGIWAVAFWGWALTLGQGQVFFDAKFFTLQRLLGLVQTTGLNATGPGPVKSLSQKASVYGASYALLFLGAVAWLSLVVPVLRRRATSADSFVFALLTTTYAFAGYTALFGQFNVQFFFYVIPFAAIGITHVALAAAGRSSWRRLALGLVGAVLVVVNVASFSNVYVTQTSRGFQQLAAAVDRRVPSCAVVNSSGEIEAWQYAAPNRTITEYASGPAATRAGVQYFLLGVWAAKNNAPNMNPQLRAYIQRYGTELARFQSRDYETYRLYRVTPSAFATGAGESDGGGSVFFATRGANCGGFTIADGDDAAMLTGFDTLGGRAVLGVPVSRTWTAGGAIRQALTTGVLATDAAGTARLAPVVRQLLTTDPDAARSSGIPATATGSANLLTDPVINQLYLGSPTPDTASLQRAQARWGAPLSAPTRVGTTVRQSFANVVIERPAAGGPARLGVIAPTLARTGLVPATAQRPEPQQAGSGNPYDGDSPIWWFLALFGIAVGAWAAAVRVVARRRPKTTADTGPLRPTPVLARIGGRDD